MSCVILSASRVMRFVAYIKCFIVFLCYSKFVCTDIELIMFHGWHICVYHLILVRHEEPILAIVYDGGEYTQSELAVQDR